MLDAAESEGLLGRGEHHRRADIGQHRGGPGHGGRPARLPLHLHHARQDRRGEAATSAGLRRQGGDLPHGGAARASRCPTTRWPSRSPRRTPGAFQPNQYRNPPTRRSHERRDRPRNLAADGRPHHPLRRGGGHGRHDQRRRPLPQGAEPRRRGDRRGSRGLHLLGRRRPPLSGRGHRRGLLARRPTTRAWSIGWCRCRTGTPFSRRGGSPGRRGSSSAVRRARRCGPLSRSGAELGPDDVVVVLIPDSGRGYLSKLYDDDWMAEHGFVEAAGRHGRRRCWRQGRAPPAARPRAPRGDRADGDRDPRGVRRLPAAGGQGRAAAGPGRGGGVGDRPGAARAGPAPPRGPRPAGPSP